MFIKKEHKILFIVSSLNQGGLETYLLRFLKHTGLPNVHVLCKLGILGNLYSEYESVTDSVISMKLGYVNLFSWIRLYMYMRENRFTTVCDFTGNFAGIPLCIAFFAGVEKRISFYRGAENHFEMTLLRIQYNNFVRWLTLHYSTVILSNSQAALDYFYPVINRGNPFFKVIYNGVDTSKFVRSDKTAILEEFNIPVGAFVVGHTGRVCYAKNHNTIIEVAIKLCSTHKDIYFVLAGKGVDSTYREKIEKLQLEPQILLLGYRDDVARLLNIFDLFYFPSVTEGQPNSLLEAMTSGIPIVASNIAPIKESVPSSIHHLLLNPLDVDAAVSRIEAYYLKRSLMQEAICQKWAISNYASGKRFEIFRNILYSC